MLFHVAGDSEATAAIVQKRIEIKSFFGIFSYNKEVKEIKSFDVDELLQRGADCNYATELGDTVLMQAAERGTPETIKKLLESGAKVNAQPKFGGTALTKAVREGKIENVRAILDFDYAKYGMEKVDLNISYQVNGHIVNALSIADKNEFSEISNLLVANKAELPVLKSTAAIPVVNAFKAPPTLMKEEEAPVAAIVDISNIPVAQIANSEAIPVLKVEREVQNAGR